MDSMENIVISGVHEGREEKEQPQQQEISKKKSFQPLDNVVQTPKVELKKQAETSAAAAAAVASTKTHTAAGAAGIQEVSMDELGDDLVVCILSFVSSVKSLANFALTCKRAQHLVCHVSSTDHFFEILYQEAFGKKRDYHHINKSNDNSNISGHATNVDCSHDDTAEQGLQPQQQHPSSTGRARYKRLYRLRQGLMYSDIVPYATQSQGGKTTVKTTKKTKTVGVLSPAEEAEAVIYDNPSSWIPPINNENNNNIECIGYFELRELHSFHTSGSSGGGPVLVWGDYNGLRIAPSLDQLVNDYEDKENDTKQPASTSQIIGNNINAAPNRATVFEIVGQGSQVMAVVVSPSAEYMFLGFASGEVMAVKVDITTTGPSTTAAASGHIGHCHQETCYKYTTTSIAIEHTNEVTALALLPCKDDSYCLASCGMDGTIYVYWNANKGDLDQVFTLYNLTYAHLFSMCSSLYPGKAGLVSPYLCCGQFFESQGVLLLFECSSKTLESLITGVLRFCDERVVGIDSRVTRLMTPHEESDIVVAGTSEGEIQVLRVVSVADEPESSIDTHHFDTTIVSTKARLKLELQYLIRNAHVGTVEAFQVEGNIMLSSGAGTEGQIKAWDFRTGALVGVVNVHPGRLYPPLVRRPSADEKKAGRRHKQRQVKLKSAIVSIVACRDRDSLIFLCRDGTLVEWEYRNIDLGGHNSLLNGETAPQQLGTSVTVGDSGDKKMAAAASTNRPPLVANVPLSGIRIPHPHDVLCGRHHTAVRHGGNLYFRKLIEQCKDRYLNASTIEASEIAVNIVNAIREQNPMGRFLKQDETAQLWYDIGDKAAKDKASKQLWEVRRGKTVAPRDQSRSGGSAKASGVHRSSSVSSKTSRSSSGGRSRDNSNDNTSTSNTEVEHQWSCHRCTFLNGAKRVKCSMCGTRRKRRRSSS